GLGGDRAPAGGDRAQARLPAGRPPARALRLAARGQDTPVIGHGPDPERHAPDSSPASPGADCALREPGYIWNMLLPFQFGSKRAKRCGPRGRSRACADLDWMTKA